MARRVRPALALAIAAAASGCAIGPDHQAPRMQVGERFSVRPPPGISGAEARTEAWWVTLQDPILNDLVARVDLQNIELRRALLAIETYRAQFTIDFSLLFPDINTGIAYSRRRVDANQIGVPTPDVLRQGFSNWQWNIASAAWEIDVWGALRRQVEAGVSSLQASAAQYRGVLVGIRAEVASAYVTLRQLQAQREALRQLAAGYDKLLFAIEAKVRNQVGSKTELAEIRSRRASALGDAARFDALIAQQVAGIAILLAETPGRMREVLEPVRPIPSCDTPVAIGVPATLLARRADVDAAERQLQAATAGIGVAQADYLPRFTFNGNFIIQTPNFANLTDISSNMTYGMTPAISWNFMNILTGRSEAVVIQARMRALDALLKYQLAVITAINQVERSVAAYGAALAARESYRTAAAEIESAYELAFLQYGRGTMNLSTLVLYLQAAVTARDGLAQASGLTALNYVELYRSLGGGWEASPMPEDWERVRKDFEAHPKANDFLAPPSKDDAAG
jgi:NodT family efflux transporter outer membrane factor (OMF) lipoprotein